jgi:hypothetical protein
MVALGPAVMKSQTVGSDRENGMVTERTQQWSLTFMQTERRNSQATARAAVGKEAGQAATELVVVLGGGCPHVEGLSNDDAMDGTELPSYIIDYFGGRVSADGLVELTDTYSCLQDLEGLPNVKWQRFVLNSPFCRGVFEFVLPEGVEPTPKGDVPPLDSFDEDEDDEG